MADKAGFSSGALAGLRILECGDLMAAPYAAKLLGHLGADVVKLEDSRGDSARRRGPFPPGSPDPECSGMHLFVNQAKRGVAIDWSHPGARSRFDDLVRAADALIVSRPPREIERMGLTYADLAPINPALVVVTITPFGMTGPRRDWAASDITQIAAGGWLYLSPGGVDDPARPPLKPFGDQSDLQGGIHGAIVAIAALMERERGGRGQQIDVSVQACIASNLEGTFPLWDYAGKVASRLGHPMLGPRGFIHLADGDFFMYCVEEHQWRALVECMGRPQWAALELFADREQRGTNCDALMPLIENELRALGCREAFARLQARRIPAAPVFDVPMLLDAEQLKARGFFVRVDHPRAGTLIYPGAPFKASATPWEVRRRAPTLGEHTREVLSQWTPAARIAGESAPAAAPPPAASSAPPLAGVRILDFTHVWAGPEATLVLAMLGADVIKVETATRLDVLRCIQPFAGGIPSPDRAGYYIQYNQQKRAITLDLKHPEARAVAIELAARCDVVVDNFSAGVMDRLGLGYRQLSERRPDIIVASLSGLGATGPNASYTAYGAVQVSLSGLAALSGYEDGGPSEVGISLGDPNGGLHAAAAIAAALWYRTRTGFGQFIDMSQWEAAVTMVAEAMLAYQMTGAQPARRGNRDPIEAPQGVFACAGDDEWIAVGCRSDRQWAGLARAIGAPESAADPRFATREGRKRHEAELEEMIARWSRGRSAQEAVSALQREEVPAYKALSNRELAADEQIEAVGAFTDLIQQEAGKRRHIGAPWRFSRSAAGVTRRAPRLGEHTEEVLRDLLGYDAARIAALRRRGALT